MATVFERPSGARVSLPAPLNAVPDLTGQGSQGFVERTKEKLCVRVRARKARKIQDEFELRDPRASYEVHFEAEKSDIGLQNTYFWTNYIDNSKR